MNKKLALLAVSFSLCLVALSQEIVYDSAAHMYQCSEVVKVDSMGRDALFSKVKEWIAINYKSADAVIQLADKEEGKIILKGYFFTVLFMQKVWLQHTLILDFKDGRFRYQYSDFAYKASSGDPIPFERYPKAFLNKVIGRTEEKVKSSVLSILDYLIDSKKRNDNW